MAGLSRANLIFPYKERAVYWSLANRQVRLHQQAGEFTTFRPIALNEFNRLFGKIPKEHIELRQNTMDSGRLCFDVYLYGRYEARQPSHYGSPGDYLPALEMVYKSRDGKIGYLADLSEAVRNNMKRNHLKSMIGSHKRVEYARFMVQLLNIELVEWFPWPDDIAVIEGLESQVVDGRVYWKNYMKGAPFFDNPHNAYSSYVRATYGPKIMENTKYVWKVRGKLLSFSDEARNSWHRNGGVIKI